MVQPNSGSQKVTPLVGTELVDLLGLEWNFTTTGAIAALASGGGAGQQLVNTAITTAGAGTLTGAAIAGGVITRTGPVAAYSDATDTAAAIVAVIPNAFVGQSFILRVKNGVNFTQTLTAGSGVTLSGSVVIPPSSVGAYLVTLTSLTAVTLLHLSTTLLTNNTPESITTLSTVGAGTITAAGIVGQITSRTGSQSNTAFTDTTDIATNIIAAQANAHVGVAWEWLYSNKTNATATLQGGTGVTVSGITSVPAGASAMYLVTYTAAGTVTIVGALQTQSTTVNGTFTANGATAVVVAETNVTANSTFSFGLKTVGGTPAGAPFLSAVTAGTGFSVKVAAGDTSVYNYSVWN